MKTKALDAAILAARGTVQKTLAQCKRDADDAKQRAQKIRKGRYVALQPMLIQIHKILIDVKEHHNVMLTTYGEIYVSLYDQPSLKTPVVMELLEYLTGLTNETKTTDWLSDYCAQREYRFTVGDTRVHVEVNIKTDSESCRKVVTGTTMKEVKTYAFVCD